MNDPSSDSIISGGRPGFDSLDCEFVISDEPGDTTVRPARPLLRKLGEAEREKIARWGKQTGQQPPHSEGPGNSSGSNNK